MVASSEQHNAPVMVSKPATAHASSSQPGAPLNRDDSAEVIKMPDPIIEPITIIVASIGPRAWNQPSVIQVITIAKNFARDSQTMRLAGAGKLGVVRREQN